MVTGRGYSPYIFARAVPSGKISLFGLLSHVIRNSTTQTTFTMELNAATIFAMQIIPVATLLLGIIAVYILTRMIGRTEEGITYEAEETRRELKLLISLMEPLAAELGPMFRTIIERNKKLTTSIVDTNLNLASRQGGILHQLQRMQKETSVQFEMVLNGAGRSNIGCDATVQTNQVPKSHRAAQTDYVVLDME
eukprot:sb/3470986/